MPFISNTLHTLGKWWGIAKINLIRKLTTPFDANSTHTVIRKSKYFWIMTPFTKSASHNTNELSQNGEYNKCLSF